MEFRITFYESFNRFSTIESRTPDEEDTISASEINLLFEYRKDIGVEAVRKIKGIISWELNNSWYSSDEIERMLKIKAFS